MYETKFIILDRDGVINHDSENFIKSADEWIAIENSILAIKLLSQAGWKVCVATNQSGLSRGKFTQADLDAMHKKMLDLVAKAGGKIEQIEYCADLPDTNSECRKPKAGMLKKLAQDLNLPLNKAIMVGDSKRDLEAGLAVNTKVFLVLTGKGQKTYKELENEQNPQLNPNKKLEVFADLYQLANYLINFKNN